MTNQPTEPKFKHGDKVAVYTRDRDYDYGTVISGYEELGSPISPYLYLVQCVKEYQPRDYIKLEYIHELGLEAFKPFHPNTPIFPAEVQLGDTIYYEYVYDGVKRTFEGTVHTITTHSALAAHTTVYNFYNKETQRIFSVGQTVLVTLISRPELEPEPEDTHESNTPHPIEYWMIRTGDTVRHEYVREGVKFIKEGVVHVVETRRSRNNRTEIHSYYNDKGRLIFSVTEKVGIAPDSTESTTLVNRPEPDETLNHIQARNLYKMMREGSPTGDMWAEWEDHLPNTRQNWITMYNDLDNPNQ